MCPEPAPAPTPPAALQVPLYVVTNDKIGLLGARAQAIRLARAVQQEG